MAQLQNLSLNKETQPNYRNSSRMHPPLTTMQEMDLKLKYNGQGGIFHHLGQVWIRNKGIFHLLAYLYGLFTQNLQNVQVVRAQRCK
jgi:hypothetical protein